MTKSFYVDLFYEDTGEPFDLTGVTEIVALFPGASGTAIEERYSQGEVSVIGAPGSGKIQINCAADDTAQMLISQANGQYTYLQVIVTIGGVAQIDTLSLANPPVPGQTYMVTLSGSPFSYTPVTGDTAQTVFTQIGLQVSQSGLPITPVVGGSGNSATLTLTSQIPALGFYDVVSSNITKTATTANGGTRSIFLLRGVLDIQPQSYTGA
jgi:hypothetical protein